MLVILLWVGCDARVVGLRAEGETSPARVEVEPDHAETPAGETVSFTATVTDGSGQPVDEEVVWSSRDTALVEIAEDGRVTARRMGTVVIVGRAGAVRDSATLRIGRSISEAGGQVVSADSAVRLEIPENATSGQILVTVETSKSPGDTTLVSGQVYELLPDGTQFARMVGLEIAYDESDIPEGYDETQLSLRQEVSSGWQRIDGSQVDTAGNVVRAEIAHFSRYAAVVAGPIASILVSPGGADVGVGDTVRFDATVVDAAGDTVDRPVRWSSSDSEVATVDDDGTMVARGDGSVEIRASSGGTTGTASVNVGGVSAAAVEVSPGTAQAEVDQNIHFSAAVLDENGDTLDRSVSWSSSDPSVATVDADGKAWAQAEGTATITASSGSTSGEAQFYVTAGTVASVDVSPDSSEVSVGDSVQLSATVLDADGNVLDRSVTWSSSDAGIASVDGSGTVIGQAEGSVEVEATSDGVSGSATVQVTSIPNDSDEVAIPSAESDWTSQGTVLRPGGSGSWDSRFPHGSPGPVIKKGDTYFMYYIGADGNRDSDGGPAHRKIGVATSSDLQNWTKHSANPLLSHSPNGDEEEGFWRLAGFLDDDGTIVLYATALTGSGGSVSGDVRLYTSTDGIRFTDHGVVLHHGDSSVWGYGDELGALGAFRAPDGTYHLYYTAKGHGADWDLGHAWGSSRGGLGNSQEALDATYEIGHGTDPIPLAGSDVVVPVGDNSGPITMRTTTLSNLGDLSASAAEYPSLSDDQFAMFLDRDNATWYAFVSRGPRGDTDYIELFTASAAP